MLNSHNCRTWIGVKNEDFGVQEINFEFHELDFGVENEIFG